jgi:tetratricopeptide (TPR) repeat protein
VTTSDAEDRIEEGLRQFKEKKFEQAVQSFERALTSEGNGTKRDRAKSKELTTAEKQSAYYNLAACHAKMENYDLAFASLELTFENGYANARTYGVARASKDFEALLNDVDLIPLKNVDERWDAITQKYRVKGSELAYQLDVSNSTIGRAIEMINKKK